MAMEAFLINPARFKGRGRRKISRKRKGGLPSSLLSRMIRTYGPGRGMKEAWVEHRKGIRRNVGNPRRRVSSVLSNGYGRMSGWGKTESRFKNPLGEEVMIVGNPRRRRVSGRRRARRRLFNPWFDAAAGHRKAAIKGWRGRRRARRNEPARRRYRRRMFLRSNPVHRRRYRRRNPARSRALAAPAISIGRPLSLLMPAAFGFGGFFAADWLPSKIGMTTDLPRLGVKAATAFGGAMILGRFLGKSNATFFAVGAGINLVNDIVRTYILKAPTLTTASGLGAFPSEFEGVDAFPDEFGAYPYEDSYPQ